MTDQEKVTLAFDMLEDADVMQEYDDRVWISVDRDLWNDFNRTIGREELVFYTLNKIRADVLRDDFAGIKELLAHVHDDVLHKYIPAQEKDE
jgi:hypothetical protein